MILNCKEVFRSSAIPVRGGMSPEFCRKMTFFLSDLTPSSVPLRLKIRAIPHKIRKERMMARSTRRDFLNTTLATAATITIAGTKSSGQVIGANDTIRIGVAGLNGRGSSHVGGFAGLPNVQVTYLIDPD